MKIVSTVVAGLTFIGVLMWGASRPCGAASGPASPPGNPADEHSGHAGGQHQNNVYVLPVDRAIVPPVMLRMYIHGSNGTDTSGDVFLKKPDGTETNIYHWTPVAVTGRPTGATNFRDVKPVEVDVSKLVNQPGKYEVRFQYGAGHFGLVILKVELASGAKPKPAPPSAPTGAPTTWYNLPSNMKYVADFPLSPRMSKTVTIPAKKETMVGFLTNATLDQEKKYGLSASHPMTGIKMEQSPGRDAVESVTGAGTNFTPKNGKINMKLTNRTGEALKVVVYYEPE